MTEDPTAGDDLSALAWVHGELRRSLETANKALRRYLKEAEAVSGSDVDAVDPSVLRTARNQLHQGVGALELVGLPAVADVLRASEAAVQRMVQRPAIVDAAAVDTVEKVSFALLDFLARQLSGKPVSPVALFPQYRAVQTLSGADRIHPADLWKVDWQWRELPPDASATPRNADDAARGDMETLVLALMRQTGHEGGPGALARMSDLCADLAAGARITAAGGSHAATFWQLAAAVFEAQAGGLLAADVYSKRIASRLLAQLRMRVKGQDEISDRLAQDLLFFCSHAKAPNAEHPAPRLAAVRKAWNLAEQPTADYETPRLGRFDPAVLALARKRVAAAKDSWSAVAGGELHRIVGLGEQFALVGESLKKLFPDGEVLAQSLQTAVAQTVSANDAPPPSLAMEVATGILYLDASLEDGEFDHPELAERVLRLARRIDDVRIGAEPQPLDAWMEELYRRVSDRQTMGSVVAELRASLSEIEKQIDQYFRDPSQRQVLIPVPAQLSAMRGVLSVLGLTHASQAAVHMRDDVDALAQTEVDPQRAIQAGTFDRLADNLGALSFLIDMLSVQPALAKSLFRFDPETGQLSAVMGQSERVSAFAAFDDGATAPATLPAPMATQPALLDQLQSLADVAGNHQVADEALAARLEPLAAQAFAADQPDLARLLGSAQRALRGGADEAGRQAVRAELAQAVAALAPPPAPELPPPAPIPPVVAAPTPTGGTGLEDDAEMREIFIEEAREVIADARAALERLADAPDNATDMTAVRRAFHTLKGSSRMVGLKDFGEAGWACEQLYNARLAQAPRMDHPLRLLSADALSYLADWTDAIAEGRAGGHSSVDVARAADAMRLDGQRLAITLPTAPPPAPAAAAEAAPPVAEPGGLVAPGFEFTLDEEMPAEAPVEAAPAEALAPVETAEPVAEDLLPVAVEEVLGGELPAVVVDEVAPPLPEPPQLEAEPELPVLDEPVGPVEVTMPLPQLSEPVDAPPVAEAVEVLDFDFDLGETTGTPETPAPSAPPAEDDWLDAPTLVIDTLQARVPDLPAAADLDLGAPPPLPEPVELPADAVAELPDFDLDLPAPPQAAEPVVEPVADALFDLPLDAPLAEAVEPAVPAAEPPPEGVEALEIDLQDLDLPFEVLATVAEPALPLAELPPEPAPEPVLEAPAEAGEAGVAGGGANEEDDEQVKVIGPLRISIPLFNIYLNEADELSRRLGTELAEWALEHERHAVPESSAALAHSLAGNSATVGYSELSALARALEHALMRSHSAGPGRAGEPELFSDAAEEIRRLLHQFAAGFLRPVAPELMERLAAHERLPAPELPAEPLLDLADPLLDGEPEPMAAPPAMPVAEEVPAPAPPAAPELRDEIDAELFPIFEEEADELLPQLQSRLRDWLDNPADSAAAAACMRTLHTVKGGARLAGAMRLGEMAHQLETNIEALVARGDMQLADVEPLVMRADAMSAAFDALRHARSMPVAPPAPVVTAPEPVPAPVPMEPEPEPLVDLSNQAEPTAAPAEASAEAAAEAPPAVETAVEVTAALEPPAPEPEPEPVAARPPAPAPAPVLSPSAVDWARFAVAAGLQPAAAVASERPAAGGPVVRVRAGLLDRLVNQAGEVSITRARIDSDVKLLQGSLGELTDSLERMRRQLRDIELQAETQISSRMEAAKAASTSFDPLEMDRFTRFQELTRFMAESVNDVATLQRSLQRTLQSTEDELAAQARLTRELQDDLLRTRMIEFESMADRLYRTVRQAARDSGKQARMELVGGGIEIDRGVLERMAGPFEHLLRNSVAHGIEAPEGRSAAGKDATGVITVTVSQSGNEVAVDVADDGGGLNLLRIRDRAIERGLMAPGAQASDDELAQMIFRPGFSTAEAVTELAGRGVGLDVVRAEVNAMGGRIETHSDWGKGTRFRLLLPLTTAVTQVVMLRCGEMQVAVPSTLIEIVRRVPSAEVEAAYQSGQLAYNGEELPFFWLPGLLQGSARGEVQGRSQIVVVIRSAAQRVAVHVDEVVGNQEVVVKNVGPQLARLPGLAGVTLLPSGAVALIYNPVALAALYGEQAHERMRQQAATAQPADAAVAAPVAEAEPLRAAMVMVVDDSLTVRRVTQRLLVREGYRVVTAKDGLEALEKLAEERPTVLLSDIEMPRMDGFDLLRNVRADAKLANLPVIMITSRIAQKHRDYAAELGVDHYLGKPYSEEELLGLVARYAGADILA